MKELAKKLGIKEEKLKDYINKCLQPNEKKVMELRYKKNMTLFEIADELKLNAERVRQIEAKALRKIRGTFPKETLLDKIKNIFKKED